MNSTRNVLRIPRLAAPVALATLLACVLATPATAAPPTTCDGQSVTIAATDGNDDITGTSGPDVIAGGDGDDTIDGKGGADVICGDAGADSLVGGAGDDRLFGGTDVYVHLHGGWSSHEGDRFLPGKGDDYVDPGQDDGAGSFVHPKDEVPDRITYDRSATAVHVDYATHTVTGEGHDTFVDVPSGGHLGDPVTDVGFVGSDRADTFDLADAIVAWVRPGAGRDQVDAHEGSVRVYESNGSGDDEYVGGPEGDIINTVDGHDAIRTGGDRDDIRARQRGADDGVSIHSGDEFDQITLHDLGRGYRIDAGSPTSPTEGDQVVVRLPRRLPVTLDLASGRAGRAHSRGRVTGVDQWFILGGGAVTIRGGRERDRVGVEQALQVDARLGAGRDLLSAFGKRLHDVRVHAEAGRDEVQLASGGFKAEVDMGAGDDYVSAIGDGRGRSVDGGPGHDRFQTSYHHYTLRHIEKLIHI